MQVLFILLAAVLAALVPHALSVGDKGASVTLAARWQGTSYLLEAAEMLVRACVHHYLFW
jgi:hypothetical protein